MDRITADELTSAAEQCDIEGFRNMAQFFYRAAFTIEEMDKDLAVCESELAAYEAENYDRQIGGDA